MKAKRRKRIKDVIPGSRRHPFQFEPGFEPVAPDPGSIEDYLDGLDRWVARIIRMRFNDDLSYEEIGERMRMDQTDVKTTIEQALAQIKRGLCRDE